MPVFCLYQSVDKALVYARIQADRAPTLDETAWLLRFTGSCEGQAAETADVLQRFIEWRFASQLEAPGTLRASYADVHEQLMNFLEIAERQRVSAAAPLTSPRQGWRSSSRGHGPLLRALAGLLALGLFVVSIWLQLLVMLVWPLVTPFRRRSGLYAVAEFSYLCTIADWSPTVHHLVRVALGRRRLWP